MEQAMDSVNLPEQKNTNINKETEKNLRLLANVIGEPKRHQECWFKNYEVDKENEKQFEICKKWDGSASITLTGKPGTGKTHLAIAMLRNFPKVEAEEKFALSKKYELESLIRGDQVRYYSDTKLKIEPEYWKEKLDSGIWKYRGANCLFVSFVELFIKINDRAMSDEGKMRILDEYAKPPNWRTGWECICFDDLGAEKLTDAKRENLYYIIDSRYREMLPTIITSNFTIQEISEVEPRIASRLAEMGKILQFNGSDYRKNRK